MWRWRAVAALLVAVALAGAAVEFWAFNFIKQEGIQCTSHHCK